MNMTKGSLWAPLIAVVALCLYGCSRPILDYRNVQIVNGKVFAGDADKPFSGTVTNFPDNELLRSQNGFRKFAYIIVHADAAPSTPIAQQLAFDTTVPVAALYTTTTSYCTVSVRDGWLDGPSKCTAPNSDTSGTQMSFSKGVLDGNVTFFDFDRSQNLVAEGSFVNGVIDGKQKVYSLKTGKLIEMVHWDNGALTGGEEAYDENTGKLTMRTNEKNGKLDGAFDQYDPRSGTKTGHGNFVDGKLEGEVQKWDASGKVISDKTFKDGVDVSAQPTS
jgi:hypothetical protein